MERFTGSLLVEQIRGRHGPFCVGLLQTSIGRFKVKDKELDQFEPGTYKGVFLIEEIFTKAVPWRGGTFTELVAKIAEGGFLIDEEQQLDDVDIPHAQVEPDPVDEGLAASNPVHAPEAKRPNEQTRHAPSNAPEVTASPKSATATAEDDLTLFGVEISQMVGVRAPRIALDPTVDRVQLRAQRERLKSMGYLFEAITQQWVLTSSAAASQN